MADVTYVSKVRITRRKGPLRDAKVPGRDAPVTFGVHSEIASHYGISEDEYPADATTLDYVVAAAGG